VGAAVAVGSAAIGAVVGDDPEPEGTADAGSGPWEARISTTMPSVARAIEATLGESRGSRTREANPDTAAPSDARPLSLPVGAGATPSSRAVSVAACGRSGRPRAPLLNVAPLS
jgi:hypothetical protein